MANKFCTINLEKNMPKVNEFKSMLILEIEKAMSNDIYVLKLIHGYGSTGVGGFLKMVTQKILSLEKKKGRVESYITGENWHIFDEITREILDCCPETRRDSDLGRYNPGITIVLLNPYQKYLS